MGGGCPRPTHRRPPTHRRRFQNVFDGTLGAATKHPKFENLQEITQAFDHDAPKNKLSVTVARNFSGRGSVTHVVYQAAFRQPGDSALAGLAYQDWHARIGIPGCF